ncbi:MAG: type II secretion system protein [Gallionella sp.]|jgi:prepilin-type N-terminal cleavage/methylation domain-containing protein
MKLKAHRKSGGFTLIEMSIVLVIVALLLAGLLPTVSSQIERARRNETLNYMNEVRDALMGYAIANKHLPCPDSNGDGSAEAACTTLISQRGTLPYNDLGVADKDAYGNALVYAVTNAFADSAVPFTLSSTGTMRVCTTSACSANLTSTSVAVIVSRGANFGNTPSTDEAKNIVNGVNTTDFVSHDFVQNGFDDLVVWLSPNTLFNRMVAAGKLP